MTYLMSAILGFVQGMAEFLPISSSGHLTLLQHFFQLQQVDTLFNILLHFATLLAVCIYYFQDVTEMVVEFFRWMGSLVSRRSSLGNAPEGRRLVLLVVVGTLPLLVVLPIKDKIEALGNRPEAVCIMLLITGTILFLSDRMGRGYKSVRDTGIKDVLLIGLAQCLATAPGLSRSGCTISAGLARGLDRKFAVRYSFLLSLPAVLGATVLEVADVVSVGGLDTALLPVYLLGMVIAGVVGYFSIHLVNLLAAKGRFGSFAYYCWAAGLVFLGMSVLG